MATVIEYGAALIRFRNTLASFGFSDDTIGAAIRLGGDCIPVFGSQLSGHYTEKSGRMCCHFAVPGWYRIEKVDGNAITIRKISDDTADPFTFWAGHLKFCLAANLECVEKGVHP